MLRNSVFSILPIQHLTRIRTCEWQTRRVCVCVCVLLLEILVKRYIDLGYSSVGALPIQKIVI